MSDAPIGVFDSGVGGLTVARAIIDQLPNESVLYVGDTAHSPYGPKPLADIRAYALAVMDDLVAQGVKLLVIACNSASSAVFRDARERFTHGAGIPVVEVILPTVRAAARTSRSKRIGVLGTEATVRSNAYVDAFVADPDVVVVQAACPRFVEFVERGVTSGEELFAAAAEYLAPLKAAGVDTVLLGCTHYPLMSAAIRYVMGPDVALVSSAEETANDVYRQLVEHGLLRTGEAPPRHVFEATGDSEVAFLRLARRFLGPEVGGVDLVRTGTIPVQRAADPAADAPSAPAASTGAPR